MGKGVHAELGSKGASSAIDLISLLPKVFPVREMQEIVLKTTVPCSVLPLTEYFVFFLSISSGNLQLEFHQICVCWGPDLQILIFSSGI